MTLWIPMRNISLSLPQELLFDTDEAAKRNFMSRSEYIRFVLDKEVASQKQKDQSKPPRQITEPEFYDLDDS